MANQCQDNSVMKQFFEQNLKSFWKTISVYTFVDVESCSFLKFENYPFSLFKKFHQLFKVNNMTIQFMSSDCLDLGHR